jgi:NTE family protein
MLASLEHPSKNSALWEDGRMQRAPPYKLAVVVAGGAARGAYEAGVIRFIFRSLAPRIGLSLWPRIVCGSSVGAFNAAVLASGSDEALQRMSTLWRELRIEQIYSVHWRGWRRIEGDRPFGLLDARPLETLLSSEFPAQALRASLETGRCETLVITATDLATGRNTLFVDTAGRPLRKRLGSNQIATEITAVHCRASSAIPFLFSPVRIGARFYVDGGLRHNTPLRPALRAGAERILVIGTKAHQDRDDPGPEHVPTPTLAFLAGKTLNALLLDPVERDLQQVRRTNRFLDWGEGEYGAEFTQEAEKDLQLRRVSCHFAVPSTDLGALAIETYRKKPPPAALGASMLLRFAANRMGDASGDLLSYLLFDRSYTAQLEELGFEDARRNEERIARFLSDEEDPTGEIARVAG